MPEVNRGPSWCEEVAGSHQPSSVAGKYTIISRADGSFAQCSICEICDWPISRPGSDSFEPLFDNRWARSETFPDFNNPLRLEPAPYFLIQEEP